MREFLSSFEGNELVIGLILFFWLLLSGLGSFLGRYFKRSSITLYAFLTLAIGVLPLVQIITIRYGRELVFSPGTSPGLYQIVWFIVIVIAPYCIVTGFILPYGLIVLRRLLSEFSSGRLYFLDSIGDISGGVLFSFILVYLLSQRTARRIGKQ